MELLGFIRLRSTDSYRDDNQTEITDKNSCTIILADEVGQGVTSTMEHTHGGIFLPSMKGTHPQRIYVPHKMSPGDLAPTSLKVGDME